MFAEMSRKRLTAGNSRVRGHEAKRTKMETGVEEAAGVQNPGVMNSNSNSFYSSGGPAHQDICQKKTIHNNNGAARAEEGAAAAAGKVADDNDCRLLGVPRRLTDWTVFEYLECLQRNCKDEAARAEEGAAAAAGEVADEIDCRLLGVPPRCSDFIIGHRVSFNILHPCTVILHHSRQIATALAMKAAYNAKDHGFRRVVWEDAPASGSTDDLLRAVLKRMGVNKDTRGVHNEDIKKEIKKKCMQWKNDGIKSLLILNGVCDDDVLVHLQHFTSIIVMTDAADFGKMIPSRKCIELEETAPVVCQNKTINNYHNGAVRAEEGAAAAAATGAVADKNDCRFLGVPPWWSDLTSENGNDQGSQIDYHYLTVLQYNSGRRATALATEAAYKAKDHGFRRVVWEDAPASGSTDDLLRAVLKRMGVNMETTGVDNEDIEKEIKKKCMQWKNDGIKSLLILNGVRDDDVLAYLQHFTSIIVTTDVAGFGEGKVASRKCIELGVAAPERRIGRQEAWPSWRSANLSSSVAVS